MKSISFHRPWHSLMAAFLIPLLAFLLACGPGEEPTPIPTATAVPTTAPAATPTSSLPGPVASPTPTSVATPTPIPAEQPRRGGRILFTTSYYLTDYDIQVTGSVTDANSVGGKLYSNLFINPRYEETECEICTDWHLENGGKTMVFNLIQGIKFHNGQEMTSADVKWSLRKMMGETDGIASPRVGVIKEYIISIETPSRYVLRINLVRPSAFLPKILAITHAPIYPDGTTRAMLAEKPYGSGPYTLTQVVPGASRKLERNPNYFKPGLPYVEEWDVVIVGDATTRMANFLTHQTQIIGDQTPQYYLPLTKLLKEDKVNFEEAIGGCGPPGVYFNNAKPPFNDLNMRKAVNLALERKFIGKVMWPIEGTAKAQLLFFPEPMDYAIPEEKIWNVVPGWGTGAKKQQEVEEAKKLVIQAGYPNGMDIKQMARSDLGSAWSYGAAHEPVQQNLGDIGIRTSLDLVASTLHQSRMQSLDFLIQAYVFCIPTRDPDEVIGTYWITGGSRNWTGYSNPEIDRLFPLMSGELDPVKRKQLFNQIREFIVFETVGYAPYTMNHSWVWWWKSLKGFEIGMDGISHNSSGWHRGDRVWLKEQ